MDINKMSSELKMESFYFAECSISRNPVIENGAIAFDLNKDIKKQGDGSYNVVLTLTANKEAGDLNIKVVASARFSMKNDDEDMVKFIMENNTVAIMFPFVRSQVSLLTTQPGMMPIVLPPINVERFKSK